jgi:transcriptional regulator with XRE-family HTH domain
MSTNGKTTPRTPRVSPRPRADALGIGGRLTEHRKRRSMRVSALAAAVGVSASLISQIERGHSQPSVSTLFALAEALDVPVDGFFRDSTDGDGFGDAAASPGPPAADPDHARNRVRARAGDDLGDTPLPGRENRYVVRRADRPSIDIEGGVRWERLTPSPLMDLEFMALEYGPGAESNPTPYRHPGTEMVLVLAGVLTITVAFDTHELGPGDSICFPSTTPHRYVNTTGEVVQAVTVILPDGTAAGPSINRRT